MFELLDPPLSVLERSRLLADQPMTGSNIVGEGSLSVMYAKILGASTRMAR